MRKLFFGALIALCSIAASGQQTERSVGRIILAEPFASGYLGVQTVEITKENFGKYNLSEVRGVAVEKVVKDSPAAKAGIQKGDVIVRFDGEEVSSVYKLTRLLNEIAPDHTAKITVLRGGSEIELNATLAKRETRQFADSFPFPGAPPQGPVIVPRLSPTLPNGAQIYPIPPMTDDGNLFIFRGGAATRQIGVNAAPLTKQLADYFGVAGGEGLLISLVGENSPAAKAGLKAGDVITAVDGKAIKNTADLIRALGDKKEGDVILTIVREKNTQTVTVTPEASKSAPGAFRNFGNSDDELQQFYQDVQRQRKKQTAPAAPPNQD